MNKTTQNYITDAYKAVVDNSSDMKIPGSIAKKLQDLLPKVLNKSIEDYISNFDNFVVLNHGNCSTNNILFKYKNNEAVDVIFVCI